MNLKLSTLSLVKRRALVFCAGLLVFGCIMTMAIREVYADSEQRRSTQHVLTIHDGGDKKGILTDKHTLREAFEEAGIPVEKNDITEPGLDEELVSGSYDVNIYRARPVTIVDGDNRSKVMSPYRTAKQIVKQANVPLQDEDRVSLEQPVDILGDGAMERLVIERATKFTLVFYGKKTTSYTMEPTVGKMLQSKDIVLGEKDKLSVKLTVPIKAGMKVEVWREGKQTVTEEESVPFPVRQIQDANREVGYKKIQTPGVKGSRVATYEVVIKNGKEVSRKEIKSVVTKKPKEQVEVVGTKTEDVAYSGGGSKDDWLAASGIPRDQWGYVDAIVSRESGWNPNARNPSSGACGLAQSYPCGKQSSFGHWTDPVANLKWQYEYVKGRYGGYKQAYDYWQIHKSY